MKRALPFLVIGGVVALLVTLSLAQPRPYDPRLRAEREGTEPFDSEVLFRLLPQWLGAPVEPVGITPFERLEDSTLTDAVYVFVTREFGPDPAEADRLLRFVRRGNTLVIAAEGLEGPLFMALGRPTDLPPRADTLGADAPLSRIEKRGQRPSDDGDIGLVTQGRLTSYPVFEEFDLNPEEDGSVLAADTLRVGRRTLAFPVHLDGATLDGIDSTRTAILSTDFRGGEATAVAITEGRGRVVVATTPLAFTNAAIATPGGGADYLAALFVYVPPVRLVLWDDTYKPLRTHNSRLAYAARTPALRWALWLVGVGAVLSVLVWGRRRQRPIPVVTSPPNAQREFARTVGRLFFVRGDRAWLAQRKTRLFADALRTRLGIPNADLSDATARLAAARAGVPESEALALFARLRDLDSNPTPAALLAADRDADAFFAARHLDAQPV